MGNQLLITVGILLIAVSPALADEIRLRNGSIIQGKIIRDDKDGVIVDLGRGRMSVARRDILAVRRSGDAETVGSTESSRQPGTPGERSKKGTDAPHDAIPAPRGGVRVGAQQVARKKKDKGMVGPGPKVVPVERNVAQVRRTGGPESASPSRKSASRSSAQSPKPDW